MILATEIETGKWYYSVVMNLFGEHISVNVYTVSQLRSGFWNNYIFNNYSCSKDSYFESTTLNAHTLHRYLRDNCIWEVEDSDDLDLLAEKLRVSRMNEIYSYEDIRSKADGSLIVRKMGEVQ